MKRAMTELKKENKRTVMTKELWKKNEWRLCEFVRQRCENVSPKPPVLGKCKPSFWGFFACWMMCWLSCAEAVSHDVSWSAHKPALWAPGNETDATTPVAMAHNSSLGCTGYGFLAHFGPHLAHEFNWSLVSATWTVGSWLDWSLMIYLNWLVAWGCETCFSFWVLLGRLGVGLSCFFMAV